MTSKLLTIEDIRNRYSCGRDAAYDVMRRAGGHMIAGRLRVREEKLDKYELGKDEEKPLPETITTKDYASQM